MSLGLAAGIVVIVYIVIELLKRYVTKTDRQQDYLPVVGVLLGVLIAVLIFYFDKSVSLGIEVGDNLLTAVATGIGSGLVATGGNQLYKKINKLSKGEYTGLSEGIDNILEQVEELQNEDD